MQEEDEENEVEVWQRQLALVHEGAGAGGLGLHVHGCFAPRAKSIVCLFFFLFKSRMLLLMKITTFRSITTSLLMA